MSPSAQRIDKNTGTVKRSAAVRKESREMVSVNRGRGGVILMSHVRIGPATRIAREM